MCMAACYNQNVKDLLERELAYLIKYSIMFDSKGEKLIKDKPRHFFKPKTFKDDPDLNNPKEQEGKQPPVNQTLRQISD